MRRGFTLLELSIVLALIGVILGGGLVVFTASVQTAQFNATVDKINTLDKALLNYRVAFNRLPCPASLTLTPTSVDYGEEAGWDSSSSIATGTGACTGTGMVPQANFSGADTGGDTVAEGAVPTRALRLPDSYMYDGWGRRFRYAVDVTMTATSAFTTTSIYPSKCSPTGISVSDASDVTGSRTTNGIYALISHGANGHGGYTTNGVALNAGSTNTDEQLNCHCDSSANATTYAPHYVQKLATVDPTSTYDNFDDLVSFKTLVQMQTQMTNSTASPCRYIAATDTQNYRINVYYLTTGAYAMEIGAGYNGVSGTPASSGTGNGQFSNPIDVAIDTSGNFWVIDGNPGNRVEEFNSNGQFLNAIGSVGTGNGQFYYPYGIAVDSSGNVWVADQSNNRIQKFSSSGTWLQTIPSGCANTSVPACTNSAANGQFSSPSNITIDSGGNIWVADQGNYRAQEFSSSGTWLLTLPPSGSVGCQTSSVPACPSNNWSTNPYTNSEKFAFDSSGNIWTGQAFSAYVVQSSAATGAVVNYYHPNYCNSCTNIAIDSSNSIWTGWIQEGYLEKINTSGVIQATYGSQGTGNGQFNSSGYTPISVAITPSR